MALAVRQMMQTQRVLEVEHELERAKARELLVRKMPHLLPERALPAQGVLELNPFAERLQG